MNWNESLYEILCSENKINSIFHRNQLFRKVTIQNYGGLIVLNKLSAYYRLEESNTIY